MSRTGTIAACLLAAASAAGWALADETAPASITDWIAAAEDPATPDAARTEALDRIQAIASIGSPGDPDTREALFALARLLPETDDPNDRASLDAMTTAATLFPDDPRTPGLLRRLGQAHLAAGSPVEAHLTFSRLLRGATSTTDSEFLALAASNAIAVGDMAAAYAWSARLVTGSAEDELGTEFWLVRLESAAALGRRAEALAARERLGDLNVEELRLNPRVLFAIANLERDEGLLIAALDHYETFINIHSDSPDRPRAMLALGRLQREAQKPDEAERTFEWIREEYPASSEAEMATLESLRGDPELGEDKKIEAYLNAARRAGSSEGALDACNRLLEDLLGSGRPMEAVGALARLARERSSLATVAARISLQRGSLRALEPLAEKNDDVGLVALASEIVSLGLSLPERLEPKVVAARSRLGLAPDRQLAELLRDARAEARRGDWSRLRVRIEPLMGHLSPASPAGAELMRLYVEALWRDGDEDRALAFLEKSAPAEATPLARPFFVLRADILFAAGRREESCADYGRALAVDDSTWVRDQLRRCGEEAPS